jgi:predicted MFS family arabinose efflux permease
MVSILTTILIAILSIPIARSIPIIGILPFLIWGAMGWSTMTPQQYILNQLKPGQEATLVALNSSAVSLGGVVGPSLGGIALESGLKAQSLPYAAASFVFCALVLQMVLIRKNLRSKV